MKPEILIIGLDGMHWGLLNQFINNGLMPNVKKIVKGGAYSPLITPFPPLTPVAWTSFQTGLKPENHGLMDFFYREEKSYMAYPYDATMNKGKSIWKYLSEKGKSVGSINMPMTYPPQKVNGYIVAGTLTPVDADIFTYPKELSAELKRELGKYYIHHTVVYEKGKIPDFLKQQRDIMNNRTKAALYLMKNHPVDVMMLHYLGTDRIQHELWHVMDSEHPAYNPAESCYKTGIDQFFRKLDANIGKIIKEVPDKCRIILMSDHGFGPVHEYFHVNTFLYKKGFLKFKKDPLTFFKRLFFNCGFTPGNVYKIMSRLGISNLRRTTNISRRYELLRKIFLSFNNVDWKNTKAYSLGNFGQIFINIKGREPLGVVSPGEEYINTINAITEKLKNLKNRQKKKVIDEVYNGKDFYGKSGNNIPDIIFKTKELKIYPLGTADFSSSNIIEPIYGHTGNHRMDGIFSITGEGVKLGKINKKIFIYDIFSLICYITGVPIPKKLDGKFNSGIFTQQHLKNYKPFYTNKPIVSYNNNNNELSKEEKETVKRHLSDLGYMG